MNRLGPIAPLQRGAGGFAFLDNGSAERQRSALPQDFLASKLKVFCVPNKRLAAKALNA